MNTLRKEDNLMKKLSDILDISPDITLETLQRARMAALTLIKRQKD